MKEALEFAKKSLEFNLIDITTRAQKDKDNKYLTSLYTSTKKAIEKIERALNPVEGDKTWWDDGCQHSDEMQYSEPANH